MGRRGLNTSFKWFLPVFATRRGRGEGIRALCIYSTEAPTEFNAPPLSKINRFTVTPQHTLPQFKRLSADNSQIHSNNFGNFLRRLANGLASTFLYLCMWSYTGMQYSYSSHCILLFYSHSYQQCIIDAESHGKKFTILIKTLWQEKRRHRLSH